MGKCKDCRYASIRISYGGRKGIFCHRYPPTFAYFQDDQSDRLDSTEMWPEVLEDDWCGEFSPKPPTKEPSDTA